MMGGHLLTRRLVVGLTVLALLGGCAAAQTTPSSSIQTPAPTGPPSSAVTTPMPSPTATPTATDSFPIATTYSTTHPMLAVSAGSGHTCAIRTDGTLACWGTEAAPPAGTFVAVSAGLEDCAIRTNGKLACWAPYHDENGHKVGVPTPPGTFTAVSHWDNYACAIRTDGTLACWDYDGSSITAPTGTFIAVTADSSGACGIQTDGTLACWEYDGSGLATPTGTFVAVSEGDDSNCAIRTDGTLACWAPDDNRQPRRRTHDGRHLLGAQSGGRRGMRDPDRRHARLLGHSGFRREWQHAEHGDADRDVQRGERRG